MKQAPTERMPGETDEQLKERIKERWIAALPPDQGPIMPEGFTTETGFLK